MLIANQNTINKTAIGSDVKNVIAAKYSAAIKFIQAIKRLISLIRRFAGDIKSKSSATLETDTNMAMRSIILLLSWLSHKGSFDTKHKCTTQ